MAERVKYPLTNEAKKAAQTLIRAWSKGEIQQVCRYEVYHWTHGKVVSKDVRIDLHKGVMMELAHYQLVEMQPISGGPGDERNAWELLLLQELIDAVNSDFQVSDFYLTTTAVGTIIAGDAIFHGSYQSAASIHGDNIQTVEQLSRALQEQLGTLLETETELRTAVEALSSTAKPEQLSTIGAVIMELGRCLQHGSNAAMILSALPLLTQYLQQIA